MTGPTSARTGAELPIARQERAGFRLSWGAIFAGLLVAISLQLVLTLAGAAIGLAAWDPNSGKALGIGAALWALLSILVSLYIGGATAGWLAGVLTRPVGMMHGVLVWALSTLVTTWLVTSGVTALAGTTFRVFGNVLGATAGAATSGAVAAVQSAAGDVNLGDVRSEIETMLRQTGDPALRPDSLRAGARQAESAATRSSASNGDVAGEIADIVRNKAGAVDRDAVINVIVARTGKSRAEAERLADRMVALRQTASAKIDTLKQAVGQRAEGAATVTAGALWMALLGLALSAGAATLGAARTATA